MWSETDEPIFIIGSERSGSNLARAVLDTHSTIAIPHPPHLVRYLAPYEHSYGDLRRRTNRERLVRDAVGLVRRHIHPWPIRCDVERAVNEAAPSVIGVSAALYDQYREHTGKARWGCKSTFMVAHVDRTLELFPRARFLWLVRDPRDVAASAVRAVFGPSHPVLMAELWDEEQRRGRAALDRWGPERVHLVRYEDLVSEPRTVVPTICEFLGTTAEPAMYEHHLSSSSRRTAELSRSWTMVASPIRTGRIGTYRGALGSRDLVEIAERVGDRARGLGYDVRPDAAPGRVRAARPRWRLLAGAALTRLGIEVRSFRQDRNFGLRVRRFVFLRAVAARAVARRLPSRRWRPSPLPSRHRGECT